MKIDIFCKSYKPDFWLLQYSLRSIIKNVTGYNRLILLIPEKDKNEFDTRDLPDRTDIHYVKDEGVGYLRQQVFKLKAHEYSNADLILFSDSDVFFDSPIDLQELFASGKPEILYTSWDKVGDAAIWREPTSRIMGEDVLYEGMRRHGLCYHRETLVNINRWKPDLEHIVMSSGRFSEFNLLTAYAMKFESEKYNFINTDNWEYSDPPFKQVWSWAKPDGDELQRTEWAKTQKVILEIFGEVI